MTWSKVLRLCLQTGSDDFVDSGRCMMWVKTFVDNGSVQFSWGATVEGKRLPYPMSYAVGKATLEHAAADVSDRLEQLTEWFLEPAAHDLAAILRSLADAGQALRFIIFDARERRTEIDELEEWLTLLYQGGDRDLTVYSHPDIHIPWGLVFDGDSERIDSGATAVDQFGQFWALKHNLACPPSAFPHPLDSLQRDAFRILSLIDPTVHKYAKEDLGPGYETLRQVLSYPVGTVTDWPEYQARKKEIQGKNVLFYYFGHQIDGKLRLGDQPLNVVKFSMMMDELAQLRGASAGPRSYNLVFLNACESASGNADYSFRSGAARPGFCGVIATEATVPRAFAQRFGCRFLDDVLTTGLSVGEAMAGLRRDGDLWPMSLLYGCYASPEFRVAPLSAITSAP